MKTGKQAETKTKETMQGETIKKLLEQSRKNQMPKINNRSNHEITGNKQRKLSN